jgi:hypothetical protein
MRLYGLVKAGDPEAVDVYLCEQDAQRGLKNCLRDETDGAVYCASRKSSSRALRRTNSLRAEVKVGNPTVLTFGMAPTGLARTRRS